jgi:uncharacterized protein YabN with tetrapyrrole methylase and pyrophosphatase domain
VSASERTAAALVGLDQLTRRLRRECPWDREQDERSIVPHTVEEAYELADAAHRADDAKLVDELGDVLFQVHFLCLLLEERGAGDLAEVAERCQAKLVRRHPHVFGEVEVGGASDVLRNWDRIKEGEEGREPGLFAEVPENLPGPLYARKIQRRAASSGFDWAGVEGPLDAVREEPRWRRPRVARRRPPIPPATLASTRSAIFSSPRCPSPASSELTQSSRCVPPPTASARGSSGPRRSRRRTAPRGVD